MKKKPELVVAPVRRYSVPRYPSHEDPNPLLESPSPYPFHRDVAAVALSFGLGACVSEAKAVPIPAKPKAKPKTSGPELRRLVPLENPFAIVRSGLPFQTSAYGTGAPDQIDEKIARQLIRRIFVEEGFDLEKAFRYKRHGVGVQLDGYDAEKKVGFVWGDWQRLGGDAIASWSGHGEYPDDDTRLSLTEAKKLEARAADGEYIAVINGFDQRFEYTSWGETEEDHKELERIQTLDEAARKDAYEAFTLKKSRAAIANLERSVREYIAWARSQGL